MSDFERSARFYDAILEALGYVRVFEGTRAVGYAPPGLRDDIFGIRPGAESFTPPAQMHIAFNARSRDAVRSFHQAGLALGAESNGDPRLHSEYGDGYFAAFLIDPDGYRLEAVCHETVVRARPEGC